MAHKIKGLGWRRGFNNPRDYTPEHPEVKEILQSAAAVSNNKKGEKLDTANLPKTIDNRRYCTPIENQGNLGRLYCKCRCRSI